WIFAAVAASMTLFGVIAFTSTPIYRSSVLLIPANIERGGALGNLSSTLGQLGGLASLAGIDVSGRQAETEEAMAVLKSRHFTEGFIRDRNLMPVLYENKWDAEKQRWKVPQSEQPTAGKAYALFGRI